MSDSLAICLHDHYAGSHFAIELLNSIQEQYAAEVLGWLSEKVGQLKLRRDHSGGLGAFEALEMLALGIQGKVRLWTALLEIRKVDRRVPDLDFPTLQARAQKQYSQMEEQRLQLAATTLAPASS